MFNILSDRPIFMNGFFVNFFLKTVVKRKLFFLSTATITILILTIGQVFAEDLPDRKQSVKNSVKPWNIGADEINFNKNTDQYTAKGNVVITKDDKKLTADFIRFDRKNMPGTPVFLYCFGLCKRAGF